MAKHLTMQWKDMLSLYITLLQFITFLQFLFVVNYLLKFLNKRDMCSFTERYITGFDIEGHHYTPLQINNFDFIKEMDIDGNKKINQYDATLLAQYVDWKKETNFNDGFNRQQW